MSYYIFSYNKPHRHFIDIDYCVDTRGKSELVFHLAAWRPGRYELANYSKNIQKWHAFDENGNELSFHKLSKDSWKVYCSTAKKVIITYNYYAQILDAGSTYLDEHQLYVNPVNCCLFVKDREHEPCQIELEIPDDYTIACGLERHQNGNLIAQNFDQLAESPFIASNSLIHQYYYVNEVKYHIWIQGQCQPNFERLIEDFKAFTQTQVDCFGSLPVNDYHFLFQITPYPSYHGVEHSNSTVILMGDFVDVFNSKKYDHILGICSHELYHTWNIKAIRPIEMLPYNYKQENYSNLGFVAEGVTTYMGDLMLKRSNVFSWEQFIITQNENLKRHYENDGRHNLSLAQSAFDTWLDGYSLGIPNRKTSIYADGALTMLMIDLFIIDHSEGKYSLNTVMKELYDQYQNTGYTEDDFQSLCLKYGGLKVNQVFSSHIYGNEDYTNTLIDALSCVGFSLEKTTNPLLSAAYFGFISINDNGKQIIKKIQNYCEADNKKLAVEDQILSVNGKSLENHSLNELLEQSEESTFTFEIKKRFKTITVSLNKGHFYPIYCLKMNSKPTSEQALLRKVWAN